MPIKINTLEILTKAEKMGKELTTTVRVQFSRDSGQTMKKSKANSYCSTGISLMVTSNIIHVLRVYISIKMTISMKDVGSMN